jgi:sugar phosphate permease
MKKIVFLGVTLLLFQGPIVPCTHAMLAKWVPPNERSRMGAFVYAGKYITVEYD